MGERILDRMNRLYKEYQQEQHAAVTPQPAAVPPTVTVLPKASSNHENIDSTSSPDELRRARTHRLIEVGAICDQYMGTRDMAPEQVMNLLNRISKLDNVKEVINP